MVPGGKMKTITICGSHKFKNEITKAALKTELAGNNVLIPIFPIDDSCHFDKDETTILQKMHKERIKMSDAILVVNVDGYIGSATKSEIEFAKSLNKEILYYSDILGEKK